MNFKERKEQVKSYLGKTVRVEIDRPIGTTHPKHKDIVYKINYGFIPGVIGGDGEELDVYVLGEGKQINEITVKIIAIIHRENDVEDKLVGAPRGMGFSVQEVADAVNFQEQFYISTVEMG